MSQFNPLTLMPVGQETEEGEEEGEEGPAADKSARREYVFYLYTSIIYSEEM